jgi:hypothetical protein
MQEDKDIDKVMRLSQIAEYGHVTRQAIYKAITLKCLKAIKKGKYWQIKLSDYEEYRADRHNPSNRKFEGELVFDLSKGHYSLQQVCKVFSVTLNRAYNLQHLYYLIRRGELKAYKTGYSWVIKKDDAIALLEKEKEAQEVRSKTYA